MLLVCRADAKGTQQRRSHRVRFEKDHGVWRKNPQIGKCCLVLKSLSSYVEYDHTYTACQFHHT